jgi:cupin 2 domain-containing protein
MVPCGMRRGHLFRGVPAPPGGEAVDALVRGADVRVERIVSRGHRSPDGFWYDQDEAEWVVLLQGAARLALADGRTLELGPGDWIHLEARERHRVEWTDPERDTIWLAVFHR